MSTRQTRRREFLKLATASIPGALAWPSLNALQAAASSTPSPIPSYLRGYEALYAQDPRAAALKWFREAKFGLFIHYGLYSQLKRGEWVQFREKIRVADYAKLKNTFAPAKFDADFITDLALEAGMRYVNLTARHHDSFCLFDTKQTDFNSVNSPARRDLVAELADTCRKKALGLCLYYSHGRDWRHPHAPNNDEWKGSARPDYDPPDPAYAYGKDHHLQKYVDFLLAQVTELLTNYGPVAAIWLDGIAVPMSGDRARFKCQNLYDLVHRLQPQALVSYKQGLLGTEDFFAPEVKAIKRQGDKPMEICDTLQKGGWGYREAAQHLIVDEARGKLRAARRDDANLLLNTGPLPDGSIHAADVSVLRAMR